ncbi:MAG TPA: LamG-like jellyroll fold domain-containing protein [Candidatus Acidoferrum sp.]|nr:LamG-like jellyroll fold domain-containing protein [Candidatus Acidoferrum sp.]
MKTTVTPSPRPLNILRFVLAGFMLTGAGLCQAQQVLHTNPGTPSWRDNYSGGSGCLFTTTATAGGVVVSHLGYYSTNTTRGLATNHFVGVYSGSLTSPQLLGQVTVPAGNGAYYYNSMYWVQLDPPLQLSSSTAYIVATLPYNGDGDWWGNNFTPTWNSYFIGSQGTTTRYYVYGPGGTTWPVASFTKVSNNQDYCVEGLANLPVGPAKVALTSTSPVTLLAGATLNLSGFSSGAPTIAYQWWQNGTALSGQTTASLSIPNVTNSNSGLYYLTATNGSGGEQTPSVVVNVYSYPVLGASPNTSGQTQTLYTGANARFAITSVNGFTPFAYQWYTNGVADASATSTSYSVNNVQATTPTTFTCIVSNSAGFATNTWNIAVVSPPANAYPATVLADSPIGYWRLNEADNALGNGNYAAVANDYVGGNSGFYTNTVLGQTGYANGLAGQYSYSPATDPETSGQFGNYPIAGATNINSYVAYIPTNVNFTTPTNNSATFSVEAWVNGIAAQAFDAGIVTIGYGGSEQFNLDTGSDSGGLHHFRFYFRDAGGATHGPSTSVALDGKWHHLVGVVDEVNSNALLYVDGISQSPATLSKSGLGVLAATAPMSIGARQASSTTNYNYQFLGNINDVALYNYALSSSQVFNHYTAPGIGAHFVTAPPASVAINQTSNLVVNAAVIGTLPVTCQWYDVTGGGNTLVASQTTGSTILSNTLTLANIQTADYNGHTLALVTSNYYGQATNYLALTVYSVPVFTTQEPAALTMYDGATLDLSVATVGPQPVNYYWLSNGVAIPNATNATLILTNLQGSALVRCAASNLWGWSTSAVVTVTALASPSAPYPAAVIADHPVGYWRLNEANNGTGNTGALANDYWGGNYGSYTNTILGQTGYSSGLSNQFGYYPATDPNETAAQFGHYAAVPANSNYVGNIQNITFATPTNTSGNFSVEAWVNGDAQQDNVSLNAAGIVAKGAWAAEQFTLDTGGASPTGYYYRFTTRDSGGAIRSAGNTNYVPDGNWHHLVGVLDESHSNLCLYVDGIKVSTTSCSPSNGVLSSAVPVTIGSRLNSAGALVQQFFGTVNDVALYNYALSSNQVVTHYVAAGIPPNFTLQPPAVTNVNEGTTLTVPTQVLGTGPLSYQWYDVGTATAIPGQTSATLAISDISQDTYNGHSLAVTVSNIFGQATSSSMAVNISAGPPNTPVLTPPNPPAMYVGLAITFTATAQGTQPFDYFWFLDSNPAPGATDSATYTYTNLLGSHSLSCTISNAEGTTSASVSPSGVDAPTDGYGVRIVNDQPMAFYRLNEAGGAGTAYDYVGGHDASYYYTFSGVPSYSPSDPNTATEFGNGFASYSVALENDQSGSGIPNIDFSTQGANTHFSIEAWVQAPAGQLSGAAILCKGYGGGGEQFCLDMYSGVYRFYVHNAAGTTRTAQSPSRGPDGNWHHLVATCDEFNGVLSLYLDGALNTTGVIVPGEGLLAPLPSGAPILTSIGSRMKNASDGNYSNQSTNTVVADVALYNYVLTATQVSNHFSFASELPAITTQPSPASLELYQGATVNYSATVIGSPPLSYQWRQNGAALPGRTTTAISLVSIVPTNTGSYDLVVTNSGGAITSSAVALTVEVPATAYESQVLASDALDYWRFNETNGTVAYDYIGGLDGTYGANTTNGVPGPSEPAFPGFETNNFAIAMAHGVSGSGAYVTAPALGLNTNALTLTCWVYPFGDITNYQGVVFSRASTYSKGIQYIGLNTSRFNTIGYTWNQNNVNTYGWPSGLITPPGQWSFVALTIAPTQAVMYVGTNGVLRAATNAIAHDVEAFNGATVFGADTASTDRTFMGALDEVALYDYTLTAADLQQIYSAAAAVPTVTLTIGWSGGNLVLGWPKGNLQQAPAVTGPWTSVSGAAPPSYSVSPPAANTFYRVHP